jgi:hypothetical protein
MEITKTICPRCFKIFEISEEIDEVKCNFCEYIYDLPRFAVQDRHGDKYIAIGSVQ